MINYYYKTTPKRKLCITKCKYANIRVGSVECRDLCKNHGGYGKDEKGKFVKCNIETCDVCGSDDIVEFAWKGKNCNCCNPLF